MHAYIHACIHTHSVLPWMVCGCVSCAVRVAHPAPPVQRCWSGSAGGSWAPHWVLIRAPRGPRRAELGTKRSRSPGQAHASTWVSSARDFLLLNNTFDVLPRSRKVECTDARCDHTSLRVLAALGACPRDRQSALPGPFPLPSLSEKTLPLTHPGPLVGLPCQPTYE